MTVTALISSVLPAFRGNQSDTADVLGSQAGWAASLQAGSCGEVVEREPRSVTIARLELLACEGDTARLAVDCSKGTYIRTLVKILREAWLVVRTLQELATHNSVGPFSPAQTVTLEELRRYAEGGNEAVGSPFPDATDKVVLPDWPVLPYFEQRVSIGSMASRYVPRMP